MIFLVTCVTALKLPMWRERIESGKTAVVAGLATSLTATPIDGLLHSRAQWEFNVDQLSIMGALFGLVFRYAVREENPQLRSGVVGAFALTRALSSVRVSDACDWAPLSCGPPLGYLDYAMLWQLLSTLVESGIAFGAAAMLIENFWERNWLKPYE